jgi:hypothetical protein
MPFMRIELTTFCSLLLVTRQMHYHYAKKAWGATRPPSYGGVICLDSILRAKEITAIGSRNATHRLQGGPCRKAYGSFGVILTFRLPGFLRSAEGTPNHSPCLQGKRSLFADHLY